MNLLVLESTRYNKLFNKIRNLARKLHNGNLKYNTTSFIGFFGDKGVKEGYSVILKDQNIHSSDIQVEIINIYNNTYCAYVKIDNMQASKTYCF